MKYSDSDIELLNTALAGAKVLEVAADDKGKPRVFIEMQDGAGVSLYGKDLECLLGKLKRDRRQISTADKLVATAKKFFGKTYANYSSALSDILEVLTVADEKVAFNPSLAQKINSRMTL